MTVFVFFCFFFFCCCCCRCCFFSEDPSSETTGETRKSSNCRKVTKMISLKQSNLYIFLLGNLEVTLKFYRFPLATSYQKCPKIYHISVNGFPVARRCTSQASTFTSSMRPISSPGAGKNTPTITCQVRFVRFYLLGPKCVFFFFLGGLLGGMKDVNSESQ